MPHVSIVPAGMALVCREADDASTRMLRGRALLAVDRRHVA